MNGTEVPRQGSQVRHNRYEVAKWDGESERHGAARRHDTAYNHDRHSTAQTKIRSAILVGTARLGAAQPLGMINQQGTACKNDASNWHGAAHKHGTAALNKNMYENRCVCLCVIIYVIQPYLVKICYG